MKRRNELDSPSFAGITATEIHTDGVLYPMMLTEPRRDLVVGKDFSTAAFGDRNGIGDVIEVSVGDQDMRRMHLRWFGLGHRIRFEERIDQQMELAGANAPSRMAMPSDLDAGVGLGVIGGAHEATFSNRRL